MLYITPRQPVSTVPVIDSLTRRMTAAFRLARPDTRIYLGVHECVCGARSDCRDFILPNGRKTHSLCVHYLAYHRAEVPDNQLAQVAQLSFGEVEPSVSAMKSQRPFLWETLPDNVQRNLLRWMMRRAANDSLAVPVIMADIVQDFPIRASPDRVFDAISTPCGLDAWWTKKSAGTPAIDAVYELWFGPEYDWHAKVTRCTAASEFELEIVCADGDWDGTRVGFQLDAAKGRTDVRFHHTGWPSVNDHYRSSAHCWAMYLRLLRRYLEHGEVVPYESRLDA